MYATIPRSPRDRGAPRIIAALDVPVPRTAAEAKRTAAERNASARRRREQAARDHAATLRRIAAGAEPAKKAGCPARPTVSASAIYGRRDRLARLRGESDEDEVLRILREWISEGGITEEQAREFCEQLGIDPNKLQLRVTSHRGAVVDTTAVYAARNRPRAAAAPSSPPAPPPARSKPKTPAALARAVYGDGTAANPGLIASSRRGSR